MSWQEGESYPRQPLSLDVEWPSGGPGKHPTSPGTIIYFQPWVTLHFSEFFKNLFPELFSLPFRETSLPIWYIIFHYKWFTHLYFYLKNRFQGQAWARPQRVHLMDSDTSVVFGNNTNTVNEMQRPVMYLYHEFRELCPSFCSDKENSPANFLLIIGIWI